MAKAVKKPAAKKPAAKKASAKPVARATKLKVGKAIKAERKCVETIPLQVVKPVFEVPILQWRYTTTRSSAGSCKPRIATARQ